MNTIRWRRSISSPPLYPVFLFPVDWRPFLSGFPVDFGYRLRTVKTINRWIILDLLTSIAEGAMLFTFIFLLKRIYELTELFVSGGTTLFTTLQMLFAILPTIMLLTFPMAILLASMMVYGRIAQDNELTALQAAGYNTVQLLVPALILGILLTSLLLWWGNRIAPKGLRLFEEIAARILQDTTTAGIRPGFNEKLGDYIIVPTTIDDRIMKNVRMFELNKGQIATTISAPTSTIDSELRENSVSLMMEKGSIYKITDAGYSMSILFDEFEFSISIPRLLNNLVSSGREEYKFNNATLRGQVVAYQTATPEIQANSNNTRWYYRCVIELNRRIALPFACLIMALLGALLGILSGKGKRSSCYAMSITIIFVYYILLNFGKNFVSSGALPGWIGIWIPNIIVFLIGGYLYYRTTRV